MNPIQSIRETIIGNLHLLKDFKEVKEFALAEFDRRNIHCIVSINDDDGYDIDEWVETKDFILWLIKTPHEDIPAWFHKCCVFELLKYKD